MKVSFTQEEVEKIVLEWVRKNISAELNTVGISTYAREFCMVTFEEPKQEEADE